MLSGFEWIVSALTKDKVHNVARLRDEARGKQSMIMALAKAFARLQLIGSIGPHTEWSGAMSKKKIGCKFHYKL